jgi:large subunit ribosomal protein L5
MAVPKLDKIVVSMGLGIAKEKDSKTKVEEATRDLTTITGQKPKQTRAHKSVAGFNLRQGLLVGLQVTLRGDRMYDFFDKLVSVAIPRVRDFTGLSRHGFDQAGNYSMGLREQGVFPEVDVNKVQVTQGMNITIGVKSRRREDAVALLEELGLPLAKE